MKLKNINLLNFRNYEKVSIDLSPGINIFIGENGSGKTNILEAIYVLSLTKSNRILHDVDLIRVVNELKNAGAEAISINNQRIISTSAIECDGNVIKINGEKIGAPFEIKAIGLPESLMSTYRFAGYLDYLENDRFLDVTVQKADKEKIKIPKYTGIIKFEYAESK